MYEYGLGKDRSPLGRFLDQNKIKQEALSNSAGLSREEVSLLCRGKATIQPTENTMRKIIGALRRSGYDVEFADFW